MARLDSSPRRRPAAFSRSSSGRIEPRWRRLLLLAAATTAAVWLLAGAPVLAAPATVRVGVFSLFRPGRLVVKPAPGRVLELHCGDRLEHLDAGYAIGFTLAGDEVDCTARGRMSSAAGASVAGRGGTASEFLLSVPGRIERRFAGTLEIRPRHGVLQAVVTLNREEAIAAIVAAESPPGALPAALEAQAVVARSFLVGSPRRHEGFELCDTTHCQFLREAPPPGAPARQAAEDTAGLILTYRDRPVAALFSSACGGRTRTPQETGLEPQQYPYFAVACDACTRDPQPWTVRLDPADAAPLVAAPHSETARLAVVRRLGWGSVKSNNYELREEGGQVVIDGRGLGHGIGLCQRGAAAMARDGASFRAILEHYFPNTSVTGY